MRCLIPKYAAFLKIILVRYYHVKIRCPISTPAWNDNGKLWKILGVVFRHSTPREHMFRVCDIEKKNGVCIAPSIKLFCSSARLDFLVTESKFPKADARLFSIIGIRNQNEQATIRIENTPIPGGLVQIFVSCVYSFKNDDIWLIPPMDYRRTRIN